MKKNLFILSIKSGTGDFQKLKNQIYNVYKENNALDKLEIIETKNENSVRNTSDLFAQTTYEDKILYICGGDGSLNEAANVVKGTDVALGLIPMGIGNDFSRNFDYSGAFLEKTIDPIIRPIDYIMVNGHISINVTSIGLDSNVLEFAYSLAEKAPFLKNTSYIFGALKNVLFPKYSNLEFDLVLESGENIKFNQKSLLAAICNGSYYGGGFNPSPHGSLEDGELELVIGKDMKRLKLWKLMPKYLKGTHLGDEDIIYHKVISGRIKSDEPFSANRDGELFKTNDLEFEIIPKGIKYVMI